MIYPVSLHADIKSNYALVSNSAKFKHLEVPAKSPVKEVPAENVLAYYINSNN